MNLAGHQSPGAQEKLKSALDYDTNHVSSSEPPGRPSSLKLSCMTGFIGASHQTLLCHPILSDIYIIAIGPVVVISNLSEPNQQRFLRGHHQNIAVVSISLTGKYIASGEISSSGALKPSICLWDFYSGVLSSRFGSTRGQMKLVEFSSDDRWIAAWSDDNILNIWEIESGDLVLVAPRQQYSCMKFGPAIPSNRSRRNPSYLLYACVQNSVLILTFHYDIKTMQYEMSSRRCDLPGRCALIRTFTCCTLDHDNSHLICGSSTGDICIFHVGLGQYKSSFQVCSGGVRSIVLFDDILLVGGGDGVLYKFGRTGQEWMLNTQKKLLGSVTNLSLTSDKKEILSGTNQSCIYRSRVSDLESLLIQRSSPGLISQIAFPSDPGLCLAATISSSGSVLVWDLADLSIISSYQGSSPGSSIVFISGSKIDSNGSHALTGWDDGSIQLYSVSEERMLWQIYDAGRGAIIALQQYQDIIAVAGSKSGAIRIWNKSTRAMLSEYVAHSCFPIIDVILDKTRPHLIHSLGPDKRLVSYDYCKKLYMSGHQLDGSAYQAISQRQQGLKRNPSKYFSRNLTLTFSGEHEIAAGLTDGRILIYDLDLSDPVYIHESRSSKPVTALSFSSDGHYLATIEAPDQIIVYEFTSQQNLRYIDSIFLHSSKIVSVSFTPDKQQIVCICRFRSCLTNHTFEDAFVF